MSCCVTQGTNVNLEAEKEGMLGSTQSATTIAGLPPEKLVLNRRPLEEKVSLLPLPSSAGHSNAGRGQSNA